MGNFPYIKLPKFRRFGVVFKNCFSAHSARSFPIWLSFIPVSYSVRDCGSKHLIIENLCLVFGDWLVIMIREV